MYFEFLDYIVPKKTCKRKRNLPWITGEHRHLIRKQNKLHKRLKQHCTLENKKKYNNHRKKVNTILYKAEQMYVNKLSNNYSKQPKRFWNFVKQNQSNQSGIGVTIQCNVVGSVVRSDPCFSSVII